MKLFCAAMEKEATTISGLPSWLFASKWGGWGKKCKAELKLVAWCA